MFYVIGSGPSGVAAASALLEHGCPVTMLDVGETLEDAYHTSSQLHDKESWSPTALKRVYGSTFPYALQEMRDDVQHGTRCVQSLALGGLSNVWGAAVLPSRDRDMADWPQATRDLAQGYAAIARFMPIAAREDDLASVLPLFAPPQLPLRLSSQARVLEAHLDGHRAGLQREGVSFGQSRLAVHSTTSTHATGCQYTGQCLIGCPHFAIWSSAEAVKQLRSRGLSYRGRCRVEALRVSDGRVVIDVSEAGHRESLQADRVFVACGPVATARLLLHSLDAYDQPRTLQYQPYFLLPMLQHRRIDGVEDEALHTLSQLFVEIDNAAVSPCTVHLQFYSFNSFIRQRVQRVVRLLGPLSSRAREALTGRLLAVQGYLHSTTAPGIRVVARRNGDRTRLVFSARPAPFDDIRRVTRHLWRLREQVGATPLTALLTVGQPGDGNHCGGIFPMRESPGDFETNALGELAALPGVHLVDSSVLPSLPATTLTYTVMANAYRIASAVSQAA